MPFNELQRRDSWPPTVVRVRDNDDDYPDAIADTIDENPFAYFLSSPEDFDDGIEDLSAGIESLDAPKPPVRTISPSSLQRVQAHSSDEDDDEEDEEDDVVFGVAMPLSLRDFTRAHRKKREEEELHKSFREHRARPRHTSQPTNNPRRGRATIRLAPPRGAGRGRGYTRSLSARRPRSWREPSPDITSIEEVSESGSDKGDDKAKEGDGSENETKVSPNAESEAQDIPSPKPTKHVHWAF